MLTSDVTVNPSAAEQLCKLRRTTLLSPFMPLKTCGPCKEQEKYLVTLNNNIDSFPRQKPTRYELVLRGGYITAGVTEKTNLGSLIFRC